MNGTKRLSMVAAAWAFGALGALGLAGEPAEYVSFDAEGWRFATAIEGEEDVLGFLSWVTDGSSTGNNVTLLWHELAPDGSFDSFAWDHNDIGAAALWLRGYANDGTLFRDDLDVLEAIELSDPFNVDAPYAFQNGLFADDPVQLLVSSTDSAPALLEALTDAGYATAPSFSVMDVTTSLSIVGGGINPTPKVPDSCIAVYGSETGVLLNDLYRTAAALLAGDQPPVDSCSWCKCAKTYGKWTVAPTTPWVLIGSTPLAGGAKECKWQRPASRSWSKSGKTLICLNCADSGTESGCEVATDIVDPGVACPAVPPSDASSVFIRNCNP